MGTSCKFLYWINKVKVIDLFLWYNGNGDYMRKVFDYVLLFVGIGMMAFGFYTIMQDKKEIEVEPEPVPVEKNDFEAYLKNTCWTNEVIAEETSDGRVKAICFKDNGDFSYKYLQGNKEIVEGFEDFVTFKYDEESNSIMLFDKDEDENNTLVLNIYSINNDRMTITYNNRMVYFKYYCAV